ncbi:RHS repeat domain-containing protein [Aquimarina sp. 2201CG14-23]|uniref:RHS repeat domain-containing protein n=1 Tax=Aquimarina mycalae TaxID=3040073 RepID=UPI0024780574|nr:RHS repeat-associated core domain-containing protein [Aquimarina sp. 2201CG14-23]MDH7448431.1 RHS repeat-associated core domain-containing protein [Aquimarina sp. 2201CG14-23]
MGCLKLHIEPLSTLRVIRSKKEIKSSKKTGSYYPFGLQHKGYNNTIVGRKHNYGFTGKEEQDELGLAWIDITARNYDPAIARWMNLDPLAEQMRRHSPYNYAFNSPIFFMDPDGMAPQGPCTDCPWYLRSRGENRKPVLTLGLHNIELPTIDRMESGGVIGFLENTLRSAWNGAASTWNAGMKGQNMGEITDAAMGEMHKTADRIVEGEGTQEDVENLAASVLMVVIKGKTSSKKNSKYTPDRKLKNDPKTGRPIIDPEASGKTHTQLGKKKSSNKGVGTYTTRRTIDKDGSVRKTIDYTDHGRPKNHKNPHTHNYHKTKNGQYKRQKKEKYD